MNPEKDIENDKLSGLIKQKFPKEFQERIAEDEEDLASQKNKIFVAFKIGNTHELLAEGHNNHKWTLFVRPAQPIVEKIVIELHPTFHPHRITLNAPPWEISMVRKNLDSFVSIRISHKLENRLVGEPSPFRLEQAPYPFDVSSCHF